MELLKKQKDKISLKHRRKKCMHYLAYLANVMNESENSCYRPAKIYNSYLSNYHPESAMNIKQNNLFFCSVNYLFLRRL